MRMRGCQDNDWKQDKSTHHPPSSNRYSRLTATAGYTPSHFPPSLRHAATEPWLFHVPQTEPLDQTFSTSSAAAVMTDSSPHSTTSSTFKNERTTVETDERQTVDRSREPRASTSWTTSADNAHGGQRTVTASTSMSRTSHPPPTSVLARDVMRAPKYGGHSKREQLGSINESWGDMPGDPPRIGLFQPPPDLLDRAPSPFREAAAKWQRTTVKTARWDQPTPSPNDSQAEHLDYGDQ
ncbi:hypothetical protein CcaverHIS002_0209670 [Cutaneotrichosporon cavernicola]|uniref:Uncharacterized protein n=1 Tax=Cutaneotrichosporon cavernicola TaxID=279322 RepID=A0AA48I5C0_9TREE|nr:uncharacterized protein CcaverHIS019_0209690 [Cutaneotrichosporon cavernicola]BEI81807.1 hypothetical protein CcaverHIS002_0209670 [Cutaneotrichosporon cavernicola]BEI89607.1 hypothetical protein CcaverHIS019_0209690 [Cutaneotrichosporon cavernicola]BEI97379.1 hypothetical protein CcaverHIS631_0209680 [Cutaneotrichosporon cavernicola]BEJ05156.1 hypothetical protein CcaverHIS641_0209730 [Cutaneotrichosporon cavernicola]